MIVADEKTLSILKNPINDFCDFGSHHSSKLRIFLEHDFLNENRSHLKKSYKNVRRYNKR